MKKPLRVYALAAYLYTVQVFDIHSYAIYILLQTCSFSLARVITMIRDLIHAIPKLISEDVSTAKATFACIGVGLGLSVYGVMAYWPVSTSRQLIGNLLAGSCVLAIAYSGYFHSRRVVAACLYGLLFGVGIPGSVTVLIAGLASLF